MAEALLPLLPHLGLHMLLVWAAVAVVLTLRPLLRRGWGAQAAIWAGARSLLRRWVACCRCRQSCLPCRCSCW